MTYIEGFLTAVPTANKEAYRAHAEGAMEMFREFGATRLVEGWGDDVPRGKLNDLYGAVQATDDETVVFSWIEYPDRATRDAANERIMTDPRMEQLGELPFDAGRMIYSGFATGLDEGDGRGGYVEGFVCPVDPAKKEAYFDMARKASVVFRDHGAVRVVENWGDDVKHGERTDFFRAAHAREDETVVFSWVEWPDKAARDSGWKAVMEDERMKQSDMPFDGKRLMYGGFALLVDRN